ncbi:MAG: hypothetical protein ABI600_02015 [Luteolibacter sp.]
MDSHRIPCFIRWKAGDWGSEPATAVEVPSLTANIDLLPTLMEVIGLHDVAHRPAAVPIQGRSIKGLLSKNPADTEKAKAEFTGLIVILIAVPAQ